MPKTDIVTLDADQEARTTELLKRYDRDELNTPEALVDEWGDPQTKRLDVDFDSTTVQEYIDPTEIVGRLEGDSTHFEPSKAAQILWWLYQGEFDQFRRYPPSLEKRPEGYFVTKDGTHRSIVAKAIPLDQLYVEYYTVPESALDDM